MNSPHEQIRQETITWIQKAGAMARDRLGTAVASRKADHSPVTDVDHAVQAALMQTIGRQYPHDAVITEETQANPDRHASVVSAERCWVIDPIDGTRNYARGLPIFTISVALMEAGTPVVGWIFNPMTRQMYSASKSGGAWLDEQRIEATDGPFTGDSFIAVPSGREEPLPPIIHQWMDRAVFRTTGSTALNLALLASGALDAVFCSNCRLWDVAAGILIAEEAGAIVRSPNGQQYFPIDLATYSNATMPFLAAGPTLLNELLTEYQRDEQKP